MTDKISSLTPEQEALVVKRLEFWTKRATSVAPLDKPKVENAIAELYDFLERKLPPIRYAESTNHVFNILDMNEYPGTQRTPLFDRELRPAISAITMICRWKTRNLWRPLLRRFQTIPRWDIVSTRYNATKRWHPTPINFPQLAAIKLLANVIGQEYIGEGIYRGLSHFLKVSRYAPLWFPRQQAIMVYHPPTQLHIVNNRIHCEDGPAIVFKDGFKVFCWTGVIVPEKVILGKFTLRDIHNEHNSEIRRAMTEKMGYEKFLKKSKAQLIAQDGYGDLYEIPAMTYFGANNSYVRSFRLVKVLNSTPEPDGSYKTYVLPVPPTMETPKQAIAWTFGLREHEYNPKFET